MKVPHYWRKQEQRYQLTGSRDGCGKASIVNRQIIVPEQPKADTQAVVVITAA